MMARPVLRQRRSQLQNRGITMLRHHFAGKLLAATFFSFLSATGAAQTSLDSMLHASAAKYQIPAFAAAVVKDGKIVALGAVGTRKAGANIPVTPQDRFHLGSDTKAMTALIAAMLVEEGKLRWNSSMGEVFAELGAKMDERLKTATLEQLLSHTSGVTADSDAVFEIIGKSVYEDGNPDELRYWVLRQFMTQPLQSAPGEKMTYSNLGYVFAGVMLERVTGKTWEELMVERVFVPLGLRSGGLGPQASLGKIDAPLGHGNVNGKVQAFMAGSNGDVPIAYGPAGSAHMSVIDFAHWAGWNAGQGKRGPALVKPETIKRMHTMLTSMPDIKDAAPGTPSGGKYGLGWATLNVEWAPYPLLYHGGSNSRNLAHIWLDPARDLAIVVVANIAEPRTNTAFLTLAADLYKQYAK
jgi:CubicO group peptidase (beta-lactamase class C family)